MIAIIDYNMGNLLSVSKAFESLNTNIKVTNNPEVLRKAKGIILPGVGSFRKGMDNLEKLGLIDEILTCINNKIPFLGICLGLQLLFEESSEYGTHKGLGVLKGRVKKFSNKLKVPHMGWNQVEFNGGKTNIELFKGIENKSYFYFVHSYYVKPDNKKLSSVLTDYGIKFTCAVKKENIFGVQFHPEKSSNVGLKVLKNFTDTVYLNRGV